MWVNVFSHSKSDIKIVSFFRKWPFVNRIVILYFIVHAKVSHNYLLRKYMCHNDYEYVLKHII